MEWLFMHLYMYELELWLNEHSREVLDISFQSDEANTDRPLKEYLKNVIENKCNRIRALNNIENLRTEAIQYPITNDIKSIYVERVLLQEDINLEIEEILKRRKKTVFTKPDLCLKLNINGTITYETIELKSTKKDAIPGSSIQQVLPGEWLIFVKRGKERAEIATGQYFHAINSKMQFPDRSPRPQVSFIELQNWNSNCRHNDGKTIAYTSVGDESLKYQLLTDWQDVLAERWNEIVFDKNLRKPEPWFNNNLRKFILKFLRIYDKMSTDEKEEYKMFLNSIIE